MEDLIGELDLVTQGASLPYTSNALAELPREPVAAFMQVRSLLRQSGSVTHSNEADSVTAKIDGIVLHRYLGFPVFFLVLVSLFAAIFWAAKPFMDAVDAGFGFAGDLLTSVAPNSVVVRFLAEGVIGGVGVVAVFFPQIMILFFLMTLLEDSGYLARGATLVDRPLSYLGLHGRSLSPCFPAFACAIPAVFAARSIPARRERLLTIWILPL
jgi:Fe2+ transport system protein B